MTSEQEYNHLAKQKEIYNMSMNHKFITVDGDHNIFFNADKTSKVVDEINTLIDITNKQIQSNHNASR